MAMNSCAKDTRRYDLVLTGHCETDSCHDSSTVARSRWHCGTNGWSSSPGQRWLRRLEDGLTMGFRSLKVQMRCVTALREEYDLSALNLSRPFCRSLK